MSPLSMVATTAPIQPTVIRTRRIFGESIRDSWTSGRPSIGRLPLAPDPCRYSTSVRPGFVASRGHGRLEHLGDHREYGDDHQPDDEPRGPRAVRELVIEDRHDDRDHDGADDHQCQDPS